MAAEGTEGKIAELLLAKVSALNMESPDWPVAYPRRPFTPPDDGRYLRVELLTNKTVSRGLSHSSRNRHQGILQVMVCLPAGDTETTAGSAVTDGDLVQQVIDHFKRGTSMAGGGITVKIEEQPSRGPEFTENPQH